MTKFDLAIVSPRRWTGRQKYSEFEAPAKDAFEIALRLISKAPADCLKFEEDYWLIWDTEEDLLYRQIASDETR